MPAAALDLGVKVRLTTVLVVVFVGNFGCSLLCFQLGLENARLRCTGLRIPGESFWTDASHCACIRVATRLCQCLGLLVLGIASRKVQSIPVQSQYNSVALEQRHRAESYRQRNSQLEIDVSIGTSKQASVELTVVSYWNDMCPVEMGHQCRLWS